MDYEKLGLEEEDDILQSTLYVLGLLGEDFMNKDCMNNLWFRVMFPCRPGVQNENSVPFSEDMTAGRDILHSYIGLRLI